MSSAAAEGLPVVLFSDAEGAHTTGVDQVIALARSPFTRSLYLDADTRLVADGRDVFVLLEAWPQHYGQAGFRKDQVTLRELLWLWRPAQ